MTAREMPTPGQDVTKSLFPLSKSRKTWRWRFAGWSLRFVPRDLWVGVFWRRETPEALASGRDAMPMAGARWSGRLRVYICLLPMLPLRFEWGSEPDPLDVSTFPGDFVRRRP